MSEPPFRDVADLLKHLQLQEHLLRGHYVPHLDVIAPAPAGIRNSELKNGKGRVSFSAPTALDRSAFQIRFIQTTLEGEERRLTLNSGDIPWVDETMVSIRADIDFVGVKGLTVSLSYKGQAFSIVGLGDDAPRETTNVASLMQNDDPVTYLFGYANEAATALNHLSMVQELARLSKSIDDDPEEVFRGAKDLVESCCKGILTAQRVPFSKNLEITALTRKTLEVLELVPDDVPDDIKASQEIKSLLSALSTIVHRSAEIRNAYGTGHGRAQDFVGLSTSHARLVVSAVNGFVSFVTERYLAKAAADDEGSSDE